MKGAVLLIGSLLWENEKNSLNKKQGKLRASWRENLELENKIKIKVPIRYGRKSTSKKCTYTMIFSNSTSVLGTAFLIPFKKETSNFEEFKSQALELSVAEGISTKKYPNQLEASWGAVGVSFNKSQGNRFDKIKKLWHHEFTSFENKDYKIENENEQPSIQKNGELNFEFEIPEDIDYVFATPVKPNISGYPTIEKVIEAIIESQPKYDTYVKENIKNGIRVENDEIILTQLE